MTTPIRILYLEDEPFDVEIASALLNERGVSHDMLPVSSRKAFVDALDAEAFDLILSDYSMPGYDGMSALAEARDRCPTKPFILYSGRMREDIAIDALNAGATDYVQKQRSARLEQAVTRAMAEVETMTRTNEQEAELRRLAAVVESNSDAVLITDAEGRIQFVNPAFEAIMGHERESIIGENFEILLSYRTDEAVFRGLWESIRSGRVWSGSITAMKSDGSVIEEKVTISPVVAADDRIDNYVVVMRDLTAESRLKEQLLQAQKLEALGILSAGIAHDFNNILSCIIGYSQLAAREVPEHRHVQENLKMVKEAAERATSLVAQILTFSSRGGEDVLPIQPHYLIGEVVKLLRPGMTPTIEIQQQVDKESGLVLCEPGQLHQVVMNLCLNAFHAMGDNGGRLGIGLESFHADEAFRVRHPETTTDAFVRLWVSDTGHGMSPETIDQMYEPFFTTKPEGVGTGLGLATVHGVVSGLGGVVEVESEEGQGTRFDVYLPRTGEKVAVTPVPGDVVRGDGEWILVVEDEQHLSELVGRQLTGLGYNVVVKTSSREALEDFSRSPEFFDLVLTDCIMPGLTGPQLVDRVRELNPGIPVVAMSGGGPQLEGTSLHDPDIKLLKKPICPATLARTVRDEIDRKDAV